MDFLNRLVGRNWGDMETVRPAIVSRFAVSQVAVGPDFQGEEAIVSSDDSVVTTPVVSPTGLVNERVPAVTSPTEVRSSQTEDSPIQRREQTASPISPPSVVREVTSLNTQTRIEEVTRVVERIETQRIETVPQVSREPVSFEQPSDPLDIDSSVGRAAATSREDRRNRPSENSIEPVIVISQSSDETTSESEKRREPVVGRAVSIEPTQPNLLDLLASIQPAPVASQPLSTTEPNAPKVNISIGQLEIRVSSPKPQVRSVSHTTQVRPKLTKASLDNYLKKHS